ncbi:unnamed protein product [Penicillium glandicola]
MRTIEETRKRWDILFSDNDTPSDLRAALRSEQGGNLCNDGLRSVCWKAFLLFDGLDKAEWAPKLDESRDAYCALRDHFLKYIEHPDDLESTVDPLADDEQSPWQTLRHDETLRAEILQDVDRCLQENFFFQEPDTKSKLTDILFVYSKLNPDVGYRQGMHELLAPILWAVDRDSVKPQPGGLDASNKSEDLMLKLLDTQFVEHDSFTLFLSVMQTARIYYEHGETRSANGQIDVIPIVDRCHYLHKEALAIIDHELAEHLEAVDVLPQIFLTRWMRLLFGREFPFDDVLAMWDLLFAHGLRSDLIDFTCIAMLLRIRWQLLTADYTTALTLLLRYPSPQPHTPQNFVHDALYLEQNPTADRGSFIISKYSGRPPDSKLRNRPGTRPTRKAFLWEDFKKRSASNSPAGSSPRNSPKSLESLLQDVSQGIQGIQRRTEAWGVAKAVRGAVTEARKNMQTMHYEPNMRPGSSRPVSAASASDIQPKTPMATTASAKLGTKISLLEERNQALATILREALNDLGSQLANIKDLDSETNSAVKQALVKAESVQVCLEDSSIPVDPPLNPVVDGDSNQPAELQGTDNSATSKSESNILVDKGQSQTIKPVKADTTGSKSESGTNPVVDMASRTDSVRKTESARAIPSRSTVRPSMTDSGFSWMLGGGRNLSGFVSSTSPPPEQTRHLDQIRGKPNALFGSNGDDNPGTDSAHSELALHSLRGSRDPLSGTGPP